MISEFGEMLGKSDIQNQESVLDLAKGNISRGEKRNSQNQGQALPKHGGSEWSGSSDSFAMKEIQI